MSSARWTVGCQVSVMLGSYKDESGKERALVLEFFDVGQFVTYSCRLATTLARGLTADVFFVI